MDSLIITASSDSVDTDMKDILLILTSITGSAILFACYMKYMIIYNPGTVPHENDTTTSNV